MQGWVVRRAWWQLQWLERWRLYPLDAPAAGSWAGVMLCSSEVLMWDFKRDKWGRNHTLALLHCWWVTRGFVCNKSFTGLLDVTRWWHGACLRPAPDSSLLETIPSALPEVPCPIWAHEVVVSIPLHYLSWTVFLFYVLKSPLLDNSSTFKKNPTTKSTTFMLRKNNRKNPTIRTKPVAELGNSV